MGVPYPKGVLIMEKEIKLIAKTLKTKEGKPFTSFSAVDKNGKLVRVHFRMKDADNKPIVMPTSTCLIKIDSDLLELNRSKQYPELWIKGQPVYEDVKVQNNKAVEEMF